MTELGVSTGPDRTEKRSYTSMLTDAIEARAAGLLDVVHGATATAAGMYALAFCSATVEPRGARTRALTSPVLGNIARKFIERGEVVYLLDVDQGAVTMSEASSWSLTGGSEPETWRYQLTRSGPSTTTTGWYPGDVPDAVELELM